MILNGKTTINSKIQSVARFNPCHGDSVLILGVVQQLQQNQSTIAQFVLSWLQQYVSIIATETCLDGTSLQRVIWWSCLCARGRKLAEEHRIIFLFLSTYRQSITADMVFDNNDWSGGFFCAFLCACISENLKRETDLQKYTPNDVNQCYCTSSLEAEGQKCV